MATYGTIDHTIPSHRRSMLITDLAAGDQIDCFEILGRPARGVKFAMTAAGDTITYRLNNKLRLVKHNETGADVTHTVWARSSDFPVYSETNALQHITLDGLAVDSFEVVSLALSAGAVITAVIW